MEQGNLSCARDILQRGVLAVRGKHEAAVPLWTAWGLLEERSGTMSHCMLAVPSPTACYTTSPATCQAYFLIASAFFFMKDDVEAHDTAPLTAPPSAPA